MCRVLIACWLDSSCLDFGSPLVVLVNHKTLALFDEEG